MFAILICYRTWFGSFWGYRHCVQVAFIQAWIISFRIVALLQAMPIIYIILTLIYDLHNILGESREAFVLQSYLRYCFILYICVLCIFYFFYFILWISSHHAAWVYYYLRQQVSNACTSLCIVYDNTIAWIISCWSVALLQAMTII